MNNSKQIKIFLKNYEETIEKTISECFTVEMKRLKEVEEQNVRLTNEMRKCEEYADRLNKENEELKQQLNIYMSQYEIKIPNKYRQALEEIRSYCDEQNLKADYTACYITNRIDEVLNENS